MAYSQVARWRAISPLRFRMILRSARFAVFACLTSFAGSVGTVAEAAGSCVADEAGALAPAERAALDQSLTSLRKARGFGLGVVVSAAREVSTSPSTSKSSNIVCSEG